MGRWLRRIGIVLLALFVLVAALWSASRLRGPTAEQRQALAMFEAEPEMPGTNAFPALWLLQWDVPESEQASVVAEDVERFRSLPPSGDPARPAALANFRSVAAERYPDLEDTLASEPVNCAWDRGGCLETVRTNRDAHAARLERAAGLLERVEAVLTHDHYRSQLPAALDMPFPRLQLMPLAATRHALQFVEGDVDGALANNCRALAGWRRLAGNSDSLMLAMFSARGIQGHASLLAEMLAEIPLDHPLPPACQLALAPLQAGEMNLCTAMRGEWEFADSAIDALESDQRALARLTRWLLIDREGIAAQRAQELAWTCGGEAAAALVEDRPLGESHPARGLMRFECVANLVGCVLTDIAVPAYADYGLRMEDARARISLLRALEWMRGQAAAGNGDPARLLGELPGRTISPDRTVDLDPETGQLRMQLLYDRPETHWRIPLPPALRVQPEGATEG